MDYLFCLKYQMKMYVLFIVTSGTTYGICYYFGYREPIVFNDGQIAAFISASLTYIFIGSYINNRQNIFQNKKL